MWWSTATNKRRRCSNRLKRSFICCWKGAICLTRNSFPRWMFYRTSVYHRTMRSKKRALLGYGGFQPKRCPSPLFQSLLRCFARSRRSFIGNSLLSSGYGEELPLEDLVQHLESIGYERREPVEMVGEYSVRGGIFDVFPAEASRPVRVEFFGDEIESIRQFDVDSQRSVLKISSTTLLPLAEYPRSRSLLRELADAAQEAELGPDESWRDFSWLGVSGPADSSTRQQHLLSGSGCAARS